MWDSAKGIYQELLNEINSGGLRKDERIITSPQDAVIHTKSDKAKSSHEVINFCANNYLGLSNHPELRTAAARALNEFGFGLSSVRFICGTQSLHKELEMTLSRFLHTDDTILYSSCFEANGGLFETILSERDAVISDELNHASVIDGIRLCKATRYRYRNGDMNDLEAKLKEARGARLRLIATDGVFSMDGFIADLATICQLAERYDALVMVDDSHATGFIGEHGRGTPEHCGVEGKIDVLTSTLGKALGGASGGFTTGRRLIVDLLRQRSRPYLFSNSLAPMIAAATVKALALISQSGDLRKRLRNNTDQFRLAMVKAGFGESHGR
jgi:glycine C-acetyltransferase